MQCKVLKYKPNHDYQSHLNMLQQMESDINSWLNVGWKLKQIIQDKSWDIYAVFLTYGE